MFFIMYSCNLSTDVKALTARYVMISTSQHNEPYILSDTEKQNSVPDINPPENTNRVIEPVLVIVDLTIGSRLTRWIYWY